LFDANGSILTEWETRIIVAHENPVRKILFETDVKICREKFGEVQCRFMNMNARNVRA